MRLLRPSSSTFTRSLALLVALVVPAFAQSPSQVDATATGNAAAVREPAATNGASVPGEASESNATTTTTSESSATETNESGAPEATTNESGATTSESSATETNESGATTSAPNDPSASRAASTTPDEPPPVFEPSPEATSEAPRARRRPIERDESRQPTPFDRNGIRVGVTAGWAGSSTTDWFVLGAGLGYFVLDGLEVHADSSFWLGGNPFIATVTPGVRYVFHWVPQVKPYVGAFYRHYFVDRVGYDSDSLGGRVGLYFTIAPRAYFGGGVVYERLLDDNLFRQRDQVYPELSLAFTF